MLLWPLKLSNWPGAKAVSTKVLQQKSLKNWGKCFNNFSLRFIKRDINESASPSAFIKNQDLLFRFFTRVYKRQNNAISLHICDIFIENGLATSFEKMKRENLHVRKNS
jgi:hypothetical protein